MIGFRPPPGRQERDVFGAMTPQPGEQFAGYRIEAGAGLGGMSIVHRATDEKLGRSLR